MPGPNPLTDRPSWAPAWVPSVEGGPGLRVLRWSLAAVLAAGLASCVSRGADSPENPTLGALATTTTSSTTTSTAAVALDPAVSTPDTAPGATSSSSSTPASNPISALAAQFGTIMVELLNGAGETMQLCLFHANNGPERSQGLMGVTDFEGYDGMLFANETPVDNQFYMAGTPTPLSITWWQADGSFRNATDMEPCTETDFAQCERYPSEGSYRWAIEVPQGALDDFDIDENATFTLQSEGCTPS